MNNKTPEQLAQEYVNSRIEAGPRAFPEWSSDDVEMAFYDGYQAALDHIAAAGKMVHANNDQLQTRHTFIKDHPKR
jgi:hypothetical protein